MKKLCCILGVVGVVSVVSSQLITSYKDTLEEAIPKMEKTNQDYQNYMDELDTLDDGID